VEVIDDHRQSRLQIDHVVKLYQLIIYDKDSAIVSGGNC